MGKCLLAIQLYDVPMDRYGSHLQGTFAMIYTPPFILNYFTMSSFSQSRLSCPLKSSLLTTISFYPAIN